MVGEHVGEISGGGEKQRRPFPRGLWAAEQSAFTAMKWCSSRSGDGRQARLRSRRKLGSSHYKPAPVIRPEKLGVPMPVASSYPGVTG